MSGSSLALIGKYLGAQNGAKPCGPSRGIFNKETCAITAWLGGKARTLLIDTGQGADAFERNVERLGFDMGSIGSIVLSRGHWDHAGAML